MLCPETFRESLSTPTATFPEIFSGLLLRLNVRMCAQTLPLPQIIGGIQKIWAVPRCAKAPFSQNFEWAFVRMDPVNVQPNLKSVALTVSEIIAIVEVLGVANPQSWGTGSRSGSALVPLEWALVTSYRPSIVTFSLYLYAFQRYCRFCAPARHFFQTHL